MKQTERERELFAEILRDHQSHPHADIDGAQLRVHVALHAVVEQQLAEQTPPAVSEALERLMAQGMDRHEAVHVISSVAGQELHESFGSGSRYDEQRYSEKLAALDARTSRG